MRDTVVTVIIPTYNRKKRLRRTLKLLEMQTEQAFRVIILDNCSDYDVENLVEELDSKFSERIKIIHNQYNIGMRGNLVNTFFQDVEGWIWTLSDDDIPSIYGIEEIYKEIEANRDVGAILFSILNFADYQFGKDNILHSFTDLQRFYGKNTDVGKRRKKCMGDFIFFSNKVFSAKYVKKYIDKSILYAYSGVPQLMPILFMLYEREAKICISDRKIVAYDSADGDQWDYMNIALGMRIISDLPFKMNRKERKTIYGLIMVDFRCLTEMLRDTRAGWDVVSKLWILYKEIYRYYLNELEKIEYILRMIVLYAKI